MMNDQVSGVVRHVLTIAAGVLIQRGVLDESSAEAIVGGVIAILGVVWSWRSEKTDSMMPRGVYWLAVSVWLFPVWWVGIFVAKRMAPDAKPDAYNRRARWHSACRQCGAVEVNVG
jgi:fatty acid desaturase